VRRTSGWSIVARSLTGIVALLLLAACSNVQVAPEEKLVFQYSEGIQSLHQPTYDDYFLACHPEWGERDLSARMAGYESTRKKGEVSFSPDGLEIIKLTALGRGAYFKVERVVREPNRLQFRTLIKPDYVAINYAAFPDGAVLFLMGEPLGKVISLKPGKTKGPERNVLQSLEAHWIWERSVLGRSKWCLESLDPIPAEVSFRPLQFNENLSPEPTKH
jgi:hypothetical protein